MSDSNAPPRRHGIRVWLLAALLASSGIAQAAAPGLQFTPGRDLVPPSPDADTASPSFEVTFSGTTAQIAISIDPANPGSGTSEFDITTLSQCAIQGYGSSGIQRGGTAPFLPIGIRGDGSDTTGLTRTLPLTCAQTSQAQLASVVCLVKNGPQNSTTVVWDVLCPASGPVAPQFSSVPSGTEPPSTPALLPAIVTPKGVPASLTIGVTNLGGQTLNVSPALSNPSGGLGISPATTQAIAPSATSSFTVQCQGSTAGIRSGVVTLSSNDPIRPSFGYQIECRVTGAEFDASIQQGTPIALAATTGQSAQRAITIRNLGNVDLTLGALTGLSGRLLANVGATTLVAGGSTTLTIQCDTSTAGASGAQVLSFSTNDVDAGDGTISYPVSCEVSPPIAPEFEASPAPPGPLAIANVAGQPAKTSIVTISNTAASGTLQLSSLGALSAPLSRALSSSSIAPGGTATLTVSCASASATTSSQSLTFNTNDPTGNESSISYSISCTVTAAPVPGFSSTPVSPGPVVVSVAQGSSAASSVVLRNIGDAQLNVSVSTQPTAPFTVVSVPATLAAGASSTVPITCNAASAAPGTYARTLVLTTNDGGVPGTTVQFNLSCTVTAPIYSSIPAAPGPIGITTLQGTDAQAIVRVNNTGNRDLVVASVIVGGAPFQVLAPTSGTIAAGNGQDFVVRCTATSAGTFSSTLAVTHNAAGSPTNYGVNCLVRPAAPLFASAPVAGSGFGLSTTLNRFSTKNLLVRNDGTTSLSIGASGLTGRLSVFPTSATIAAGASTTLQLRCDGSVVGAVPTQTLRLTSNESGSPQYSYPTSCVVGPAPPTVSFELLSVLFPRLPRGNNIFQNGFE